MYKKIFEMRQFTDCDEKEDNADITCNIFACQNNLIFFF